MENLTLIISLLTLASTLVFGILNYRLNSQRKKNEWLKNNFITVLENTKGFLELEKSYSEALGQSRNETANAIKTQFRKQLVNKINSDFSGDATISNLIIEVKNK